MSNILKKFLNESAIEKSLEDAIETDIGDHDFQIQGSVVNDVSNTALVSLMYAGQAYTAATERTKSGTWTVWAWKPNAPYTSSLD